jgi:hypothetical protein
MSPDEPTGPDLSGVVADANAVGLNYVVIGGFSVIFHGYVRATRDSDPAGLGNHSTTHEVGQPGLPDGVTPSGRARAACACGLRPARCGLG